MKIYSSRAKQHIRDILAWRAYGQMPTRAFVFADILLIGILISLFLLPLPASPNAHLMATDIARVCANQNRESCYTDALVSLIKKKDFAIAQETLSALQDIDPTTKSCHVLAHYMGREALKKNPSQWLALADSVDVLACGSGFLHGVLEAYLGENPGTTLNSALSEKICNRGEDTYRKRMCTHFMGHFFVVDTNGNIDKAFPQCEGVSPELRFDCYDGMFMEDHQKLALSEHKIFPPPEYSPTYAKALEKSCARYQGEKNIACWVEMAEVYAKSYGYDASTIYKQCNENAPTQNARQSCYSKGIVILATFPYDVTPKKLTDICDPFVRSDTEFQGCQGQLISALMYYSPKFTERGIAFCSNINQKNQRQCFQELGRQLTSVVPSLARRENFCQTAPDNYKGLCANRERISTSFQ